MPIRQASTTDPLTPALLDAFERTISIERWRTYQRAAGFNDELANRLYLWNASVGQSFHFPLQTAEVALRNVSHRALGAIFGENWATDSACRNQLNPKHADDIVKAERRHFRIYGGSASTPQLVASLSLGFWVSLLRKDYTTRIWTTQLMSAFPHLEPGEGIHDVRKTATIIQDLRNRIFHQESLLGHDLSSDYAAISRMLGWICPNTRDWMRRYSSVPKVIRERPRSSQSG